MPHERPRLGERPQPVDAEFAAQTRLADAAEPNSARTACSTCSARRTPTAVEAAFADMAADRGARSVVCF